ncbi:MAG: hypothetical protein SGARI_005293 [Bacillariaceae sp.]
MSCLHVPLCYSTLKVWNLLVDNVLCYYSASAFGLPDNNHEPEPDPGPGVPSLANLCTKTFKMNLSMDTVMDAIVLNNGREEDMLLFCFQFIRSSDNRQTWSNMLKDADYFLELGEIVENLPDLWNQLVDNVFCPPKWQGEIWWGLASFVDISRSGL